MSRLSVYFVHNRRDKEGGTAPPELQIPEPQLSGPEAATVHAENNHFKSINNFIARQMFHRD